MEETVRAVGEVALIGLSAFFFANGFGSWGRASQLKAGAEKNVHSTMIYVCFTLATVLLIIGLRLR